jgi:hypothetical protein
MEVFESKGTPIKESSGRVANARKWKTLRLTMARNPSFAKSQRGFFSIRYDIVEIARVYEGGESVVGGDGGEECDLNGGPM